MGSNEGGDGPGWRGEDGFRSAFGNAAVAVEDRLRASEELNRLLLDSTGEAIYGIDTAGVCTFSNPACARLLGYERAADLLGRQMHRLIHHTRADGSPYPIEECRISRAFRDGEGTHVVDEVFWRADGTSFPAEYRSHPIRRDGEVIGSVVTFSDITERKRAEETIAEQVRLARYGREVGRALTQGGTLAEVLDRCASATVRHLEGAFARIWTVDEAGETLELHASAGMYTHLDGPHARVPVGKFKIGQIARDRRPHLTNAVVGDPAVPAQDWAKAEGMVAFAGYPLVVDGRLVGVLAMFARRALSEATIQMMASVADEIAVGIERHRAEERLHRQGEWLRVTLASIGDAVIATDLEGRVTFINGLAGSLTGWPPADAAGRPIAEVFRIVAERDRHGVESPTVRAIREGKVVGLANHTILIARDGSERSIDDSAAPIRDEAGAVIGAVLIFRDVDERRKAERALEESEARKAAILETALDAIVTMDHLGRVVEWNPAAERTFGHTRDEAVGRLVSELMLPERMRALHHQGLARHLETGEGPVLGRRFEIVAIRSGGEEFPVELAITRIPTDGPPLFTAHIRDLTEAKRAEAQRRRLNAIIEHSPDFIGLADADRRVLFVNRAGRRLVGLAGPEDVEGTAILDYFPESERDRIVREVLPALIETGHWDGEVLFRNFATGGTTPVLWNVFTMPDPETGRPSFACVSRDITESQRAERAIREREQLFHSLADSIPQLAWMAGPDGHIGWYNQRWYQYTGTTPDQMTGWGWQSVHDPAILPAVTERWKASLASLEPFDMVFPIRGADGRFRPFLTRVMPVMGEDGTVVHWFGTNTDISDRLEIEAELRAAKEEAEAANQAKTQFLAVLSHELRTPLNPILLAASSMLERPGDPAELRPTLEMIRQNVLLQARLIDDLLDVMRIVRGKMPLHWEIADCHKLVSQAVQVCRSEVLGHHLRLEVRAEAGRRHVNADPARLQQVFWNLIRNAVKFTPEGGRVSIVTRNVADPEEPEGQILIEVSDTGIGIDPAVLPLIFDPFQQGETTITRKFGGLGLGLAICKGIVDAHGGAISARSEGKGLGTTFTVSLKALPEPVDEAGAQPSAGTTAGGDDAPSRLRILAVEDEPATLRLMARLLRGLGHDVTTAGSVGDAAAIYESIDFDLIISDIGLPDGTGLDLMRRAVALRGPIPAIALTGYGMEEDIRRSREAGFTAHLTKPIDFAKLEAMIRQVSA